MGQRIRTALIAIPIALLLIKLGGLFFSLGTLLLAAVAYKEYRDMIHAAGYDLYGKAAFLGIVLLVAAASLVFLDSSLSHALLVPVTILFSLLIMLDMKGICASSGSACTSGSLDPSHVLLAIGLPHEKAHGSLRLTLSEEITKEDVDFVVEQIKAIVDRLRSMSPLYEDYIKKQQGK